MGLCGISSCTLLICNLCLVCACIRAERGQDGVHPGPSANKVGGLFLQRACAPLITHLLANACLMHSFEAPSATFLSVVEHEVVTLKEMQVKQSHGLECDNLGCEVALEASETVVCAILT